MKNAFGHAQARMVIEDFKEKYEALAHVPKFFRLYEGEELQHAFAVLHKQLNDHFISINGRIVSTRHYWADHSRDLISLIKVLNQELYDLKRAGIEVTLAPRYQDALEECEKWLSPSGGSAIPEEQEQLEVILYEPVFHRDDEKVKLTPLSSPVKLSMLGQGSFAHVFSYVDPDYGVKFALKRIKRDVSSRDLERFKKEFEYLKKVSSPYVVKAYKYNSDRNEYRMEYCDTTLRAYIAEHNNKLNFDTRRRIALQFLYGLNHIHMHELLHRDLSLQNVLIKKYDHGAVTVKLSDFGLAKEKSSSFTQSQTEMKGTIRDPLWVNFQDFTILNEIYAVGFVLAYIFTGKEGIPSNVNELGALIHKCTSLNSQERFQTIIEIIKALEALPAK